ncbi:MAG: NAD(P)H-dependent flavin oxidoreductase YrpB, nitropropane dioxygenase family [Marmoricola sp.]|nr:NAD(P)H-dependent flavin oxidoreductase YrpB, nitropropane dioxygenase family [Marmoricola sp.]
MSVLDELGVRLPVVAAPMAGGPSTPALVVAAGRAGGLGFLAAGYQSAADLARQVEEVRSAAVPFGVNLFVPNPVPVDPAEYLAYADALAEVGARHGVDTRTIPLREDDDDWQAKIGSLLEHPVPVVSFTFGIPGADVIEQLRSAGTRTFQTVTNQEEATRAVLAGVDGVVVQSAFAGGHSGTITPHCLPVEHSLVDLVALIGAVVPVPVWAGGGVSTAEQVVEVIAAGADAVVVGTVLLRATESGASATYQAVLADPGVRETLVTRAFSGRPARALTNGFTEQLDAIAPAGYPAIHHLTTALRRAAAAAGDPESINIWAGTGFRGATEEPVGDILRRLSGLLG